MQAQDREQFVKDMQSLRGCYPGQRLEDGAFLSYWTTLEHLPLAAVRSALGKAPLRFAERLPTAGQLLELARAEAKTLSNSVQRGNGWVMKPRERKLSPDSPWAKLAEYYEAENAHYEKHPETRPEDLNERRFKQFGKLWEKTYNDKWGRDEQGRGAKAAGARRGGEVHGEGEASTGASAPGAAKEGEVAA